MEREVNTKVQPADIPRPTEDSGTTIWSNVAAMAYSAAAGGIAGAAEKTVRSGQAHPDTQGSGVGRIIGEVAGGLVVASVKVAAARATSKVIEMGAAALKGHATTTTLTDLQIVKPHSRDAGAVKRSPAQKAVGTTWDYKTSAPNTFKTMNPSFLIFEEKHKPPAYKTEQQKAVGTFIMDHILKNDGTSKPVVVDPKKTEINPVGEPKSKP